MSREYGQVVEVREATLYSLKTGQMRGAWELLVYRTGKGPGQRNLWWGGVYEDEADCFKALAQWAEAGFPDPAEAA